LRLDSEIFPVVTEVLSEHVGGRRQGGEYGWGQGAWWHIQVQEQLCQLPLQAFQCPLQTGHEAVSNYRLLYSEMHPRLLFYIKSKAYAISFLFKAICKYGKNNLTMQSKLNATNCYKKP